MKQTTARKVFIENLVYKPALTTSFSERSLSSLIHCLASPTNTTVDRAIQRCPAAPNAAPTNELSVCS